MGNSKVPAYGGCGCGPSVPVARVVSAPIRVVDYSALTNKPSIQGVVLEGDRSFEELGLDEVLNVATDEDIDGLFES